MNNLGTQQSSKSEIVPQLAAILALTGAAQAGAVVHRARPALAPVNPIITTSSQIVVVEKSYTNPARVAITLRTSARFRRSGTLQRTVTPTSGNIRLFTAARGGTEITFNGTDNVFTATRLNAGVRLFAESDRPSTNLNDYQLTLTLAPGPTPVGPPATVSLTAVELTLDISASRPAPGVAPPPLPQPPANPPAGTPNDKWFGGRLLNAQDPGNNQERALLIVRQVQPTAFAGDLVLRQVMVAGNNISGLDNKVQVFDNETPTAGEVAKGNPHEFNASTIPAAGLQFWVQGRNVSSALRDTGFQLGIKGIENDGDRVAITVGVASLIILASPIIMVKKLYTNPARQMVTLRTGSPFNRTGTISRVSGAPGNTVRLFTAAAGGTEITFNGTNNVFTGAQLTAGVQLFAEAAAPSPALNDFQLTLTLSPGTGRPAGLPSTVRMTAVELTLDTFMSRTTAGVDPNPLPQPTTALPPPGTPNDKWFGGRFVHVQDPGNHHGRALLIVRQVQPAAFAGDLVLRQVAVAGNNPTGLDAKIQVFDNELPTAGEAAKANPHELNASTIPAAGLRFFVQGGTVSAALRDTGFQLGIKNLENDGDRVRMTVVRFSNLQADVPSTPARTTRLGNSPVARHTLTRGTGVALNPADFDENFNFAVAADRPLVLLEGAVQAANRINMSVVIAPVGVPVSWSRQRDRRPAPNGDHPSIIALSPNPEPTLTQSGGNPLQATLLTDAVGSFYIRPFVDCNGNGLFDHNIDLEPFMIMKLVLVRVTLNQDNSIAPVPTNLTASSAGGGIVVSGGSFNINAPNTASVHLNAQADVVGGGNDGRRGVDRVFAGWSNNIPVNLDIAGTFLDTSVAPPVNRQEFWIFASNGGVATGGTAQFPTFLAGDPAPVLVAPPLLDTGRGNGGTGGDSVGLGTSRIRSRSNLLLGQRFLVEAVDSPSNGTGANHPGFPAAQLVRYRFNLDFSAFLCFWTNINSISGPTGDPADRLYSVLRQVDWQMRGEWTVNPVTGALTVVTAPTVQITNRVTFNPPSAAVSTTVEVRFPRALSLFTRDART